MIILHVSHFKRNIYLDNCSQNSFRECNTPLLFHSACTPLPEFCVFYNFTILQSDTITHDYLRPAIIYLSLLHNHLRPLLYSGLLDQILMQRRLNWGVKMALWQFIKKYLNDFIDGSGRSSRDCHCTHTGWCARRNTPSRGLLLLCDRLMQRCGVCKSTCASYVPCFGLIKSK